MTQPLATSKMHCKKINSGAICAALCSTLMCWSSCLGGVIHWSAAQNITGAAAISTDGDLVAAFNGGQSSPTVNGVTFQAFKNPFQFASNNNQFLGGGLTGDSGLNVLLGQSAFNFNNPNPSQATVDLGAFMIGTIYQVQVFYTEQRTNLNAAGQPLNSRSLIFGSTDGVSLGSTVELLGDPNRDPSTPFGQFAIGTFVADGLDPDLTVLAGVNNSSAQLSAYQIRSVGQVPEPSSMIVFGALGLSFVSIRRRRVVADKISKNEND